MGLIDRLLHAHTIMVYTLLYAPIVMVIFFSFVNSKYMDLRSGLSLRWYIKLFNDTKVWEAFWNSIWIGLVVTLVSVVLGILVSFALTRYEFKGTTAIDYLLYIPIIIPEIAESLSILIFFITFNIPLSPWTVVIGHIAFDISFAAVVIRARMAGFDRSVEEAARILGANEIQTFIKVTIPILMPGIIASAFMAFSMSYGDYIKTSFTRGPGFNTLPIHIMTSAARGGFAPTLNALTSFSLSVAIVLALGRIIMERRAYT